ncbi:MULTISPECIES: hypothetical protein [Kitasatospora]|nr:MULTISPECIES: hypothetical protein [Kitasatospora]
MAGERSEDLPGPSRPVGRAAAERIESALLSALRHSPFLEPGTGLPAPVPAAAGS